MTVRILEDRVIDQIAAGEVVERPASVLKEVVENALDAGATELTVRLRQGGVALVEVSDNGSGMSRDDAVLCIERHATSKIRVANDLVGVSTFGFRGEALPSIGAVARLEIRTRPADEEVGTLVVVEGGRLLTVEPVACAVGTTITVRSLFGAVPVRRKFLRSRDTELGHAVEAVRQAIMRRPDVAITLTHEGNEVLRASAGEPAARVRALLGSDAEVLIPVVGGRAGVGVEGFMAPPGVHRASATGSVYAYVNGRFVRDAVVRKAVAEAWRGAIPAGRSPIVVVGIEVPGEDVDVNVHPAKTEVRFHNPRLVAEVVGDALRDALRQNVRRVQAAPTPPSETPALPLPERAPRVSAHPDDDLRLRLAAVSSRRDAGQAGLFTPTDGAAGSPPEEAVAGPPSDGASDAAAPAPTDVPIVPPVTVSPAPPGAPMVVSSPAAPWPATRWRDRTFLALHAGRYALLGDGEDLWVVDLDVLRRVWWAGKVAAGLMSRPLLVPRKVALARPDAVAVLARADALSAVGVEVTAFGPGTLAVVALPDEVDADQAEALLLAAREGSAAEAVASVVRLPELSVHEARGLVAGLDEGASVPAGAVGRLTAVALRRLLSAS